MSKFSPSVTHSLCDEEESLIDKSAEGYSDSSSVSGNEISRVEHLRICLKPRYGLRMVKNKGALLILLWNFLITNVFYYVANKSESPENHCPLCFRMIRSPIGLTLLLAGWLADVYLSRYRVIRASVVIMWTSALVITVLCIAVDESIDPSASYSQLFFLAALGLGYGCFQANVIQFGIDQLTDSSTNEIISFINWYCWTFVTSGAVTNYISECLGEVGTFIAPLYLCIALSIVAISLFMCNNVLIKEPVTENPFKLIHRVLKYARKHKRPQLRSAFTYCEDYIPSRIDFGKRKYGGPFTTEQVEDVKTFFKIIGMTIIGGGVFGMTDEYSLFTNHDLKSLVQCSSTYAFTNTYYITVAIVIPVYELFFHPLFQRCLPTISSNWKVCIGMILQVGRYIVYIILTATVTHIDYHSTNATVNLFGNTTDYCSLQDINNVPITMHTHAAMLFSIPGVISGLSYVLILTGAIQFLCAQVPYSMKGLMLGIYYGSMVVFLVISGVISDLFTLKSSLWKPDSLLTDCQFWYLMVKLAFQIIAVIGMSVAGLLYKKRKREDVLPNEHVFAEKYYAQ